MTPRHGTLAGYTHGRCRCEKCRRASRDYALSRRGLYLFDREALRDLLLELAPDGLTTEQERAEWSRKTAELSRAA